MLNIMRLCLGTITRLFCARRTLLLENLALRQQLVVFKRRHPRTRLTFLEKLFWVAARQICSDWKQFLIVVLPDTVVQWHRSGFALYWRLISRFPGRAGRKRIAKEIRDLIFRFGWSRKMRPGEHLWITITFGVLYCFFVIGHDRRRILHFNVTRHPTSPWVVQQLREAFPYESAPRFLIVDRDAKYGTEIPAAIRSMKIKRIRTSFESPWQNGVAERWVQSCRRDLLNHVIALNERHLMRLLSDYVRYYHEDRTHLALGKETPFGRPHSDGSGLVLSRARLGGLHHRYDRAA
jgi:putative transposase